MRGPTGSRAVTRSARRVLERRDQAALAWPVAIAALAVAFGRAMRARRRAQEEVQRIFELSLDLICAIEPDGRYAAVNPAFERTLGYAPGQMISRPFTDFVHPDDREASRQRFGDVLGGDEITHFENRYICRDGSARWLEWSARVAPDQRVVYASARDVTERRRIHAEQAALRRVATLIARRAPQTEIFTAIAEECARLFGTPDIEMFRYDGDSTEVVASTGRFTSEFPLGSRHPLGGENISTRILQTGQAARIDDYGTGSGSIGEAAVAMGLRSAVGHPIVVDGRLWGALIIGVTVEAPLPPETEARLAEFTQLMATAIANTESHATAERLADEQAALRRVATLVASEPSPLEVFGAVTEEAMRLLGTQAVGLLRFASDSTVTLVAQSDTPWDPPPVGTRFRLDGENLVTSLYRTRQAARLDDWAHATGEVSAMADALGVRSSVATPIVVEGRLWGTLIATTNEPEPLPPDTEVRLERFADLVATAIANTDAREAIEHLAEEQAALRRVATLVAREAPPDEVFAAVAREVAGVLGVRMTSVIRYDGRETARQVGVWGKEIPYPVGFAWPADRGGVSGLIWQTGRPARVDYADVEGPIAQTLVEEGVRFAVGVPVVVDSGMWGAMMALSTVQESLPEGIEDRLTEFTELVATAIANTQTRNELHRLAEEQSASRIRLLTEADDARRRVVRDLHDGAQQRLVHAIITLKLAQRALRATDGEAKSLVDEALEQAQQGNVELRELAHGILPSVLTRGGLQAGVDTVVSRVDVPVQLDITNDRFPAEIEASAYFIIAEALTNVVKHARATRADVEARVENGMLLFEVRDDGVGGADPGGHGLVGLADRATALGGWLEVHTSTSGGTRVAAALPLPTRNATDRLGKAAPRPPAASRP
jgi:PAS domain S-box-containing protein